MIEGGVQAIDPSFYGFELIPLERSEVVETKALREKLDLYWEENRDRREGENHADMEQVLLCSYPEERDRR